MEENVQQPSPIIVMLKQAWPIIYRITNNGFFIVIKTVKNGVITAMQQILKGGE